jgi:hypothetical protein
MLRRPKPPRIHPLAFQHRTIAASAPKELEDFKELKLDHKSEGGILTYDSQDNKWESVSNNEFIEDLIEASEFIDAIIDGGTATSEQFYVEAFDLDGGSA